MLLINHLGSVFTGTFRLRLAVVGLLMMPLVMVQAQNTKGDKPVVTTGPIREGGNNRILPISKNKSARIRSRSANPRKPGILKNIFQETGSKGPSGERASVSPKRIKTPSSASRSAEQSGLNSIPFTTTYGERPASGDRAYSGNRTASGKRLVTRQPSSRSIHIYNWSGPSARNITPERPQQEKPWSGRTASGQKLEERKPERNTRNLYVNKGNFLANTGVRSRSSEKISSRPAEPVRTVRSSDGSKVTRVKLAAQSVSKNYLSRPKNNVYWGKFTPNRDRITTDMFGRPLRRMDYRSPVNLTVKSDTLPNVDRRTRRETGLSSSKTPGYRTATKSGTAWQGDISGKKIRTASSDPRRDGSSESLPRQAFGLARQLRPAGQAISKAGGLNALERFAVGSRMNPSRSFGSGFSGLSNGRTDGFMPSKGNMRSNTRFAGRMKWNAGSASVNQGSLLKRSAEYGSSSGRAAAYRFRGQADFFASPMAGAGGQSMFSFRKSVPAGAGGTLRQGISDASGGTRSRGFSTFRTGDRNTQNIGGAHQLNMAKFGSSFSGMKMQPWIQGGFRGSSNGSGLMGPSWRTIKSTRSELSARSGFANRSLYANQKLPLQRRGAGTPSLRSDGSAPRFLHNGNSSRENIQSGFRRNSVNRAEVGGYRQLNESKYGSQFGFSGVDVPQIIRIRKSTEGNFSANRYNQLKLSRESNLTRGSFGLNGSEGLRNFGAAGMQTFRRPVARKKFPGQKGSGADRTTIPNSRLASSNRGKAQQSADAFGGGLYSARRISVSAREYTYRPRPLNKANIGGYRQLNLSKYGSQAGSSGYQFSGVIPVRKPGEVRLSSGGRISRISPVNVGSYRQLNLIKYGSQAGSSGYQFSGVIPVRKPGEVRLSSGGRISKVSPLNVGSYRQLNLSKYGNQSGRSDTRYTGESFRRKSYSNSGEEARYSGDIRISKPSQQILTGPVSPYRSAPRKFMGDPTLTFRQLSIVPIGRKEWERAGTYRSTGSEIDDQRVAVYADKIRTNPFRNPYVQNPNADAQSLKKLRPADGMYALNGLYLKKSNSPDKANVERTAMNYRVWKIDHSRVALTSGLTGKVAAERFIHHPKSSPEALKVHEPNKAFIRSGLVQANLKMRKYEELSLHPDARFAHLREDNVEGERTLFTSIRMVFDKKFKRNDLQPSNVKEKIRRPRYDPKEVGLWYD